MSAETNRYMTPNVYNCRRCWAELRLTGTEVEEVIVSEGELRCVDGNCPDKRPPETFQVKKEDER